MLEKISQISTILSCVFGLLGIIGLGAAIKFVFEVKNNTSILVGNITELKNILEINSSVVINGDGNSVGNVNINNP